MGFLSCFCFVCFFNSRHNDSSQLAVLTLHTQEADPNLQPLNLSSLFNRVYKGEYQHSDERTVTVTVNKNKYSDNIRSDKSPDQNFWAQFCQTVRKDCVSTTAC